MRDDHIRTLQSLCDTPICMNSIVSCAGKRWRIERRVAGTKQVSTVGHLPPDPPPLSFLDSSSALSPWTSYQYRLVLHNQAGNTTGKAIIMSLTEIKLNLSKMYACCILHCLVPALCDYPLLFSGRIFNRIFLRAGPWVNITTRPSRPAGLSPPRVKVLGPESLQVWAPFCLADLSQVL